MGGSSSSCSDVPTSFTVTPSVSSNWEPKSNGDGTYSVIVTANACDYCSNLLNSTVNFAYESAYDYPSFSGTILDCSHFDFAMGTYTMKVYQLTYTKV